MAIIGMMMNGEWWESDDMDVRDAERLLDEIDSGNSTGFDSTGKNSTVNRRKDKAVSHIPPMKDADMVVEEARKLAKKTVERSARTGDKKARAMEIIVKLDREGVDQAKVIKAVMEDLGITYANARYYYVSQFKKNGNR